jgi:DNA-binding response OmpR family regulator
MSRILLVEDQLDIRRLIRMALEFEDHDIREAGTGPEALALLQDWSPELVLLDVMMPGGLSGLDLCRALRSHPATALVPVVMLSARAQAVDREAGLQAGANIYLMKPFSPMELVETVQALLPPSA